MEWTRVLLVILIVQPHVRSTKSKSLEMGKDILKGVLKDMKDLAVEEGINFIKKKLTDSNTQEQSGMLEDVVKKGIDIMKSKFEDSNTQAQSGVADEPSADPVPEITGPVAVGYALSQAHLNKNPFTSKGAEARLPSGGVKHFSFLLVKHGSATVYTLQVDGSGVRGYWLLRDGAIDIPRTPTDSDPRYVFAPDFNGGSWSVSTGDKGMLRLKLTESVEGTPKKGTFMMKDSFAYMHFSEGGWSLQVQDRKCNVDAPDFEGEKLVRLNIKDCDVTTINSRDFEINGANVNTLSLALFIILATTSVY